MIWSVIILIVVFIGFIVLISLEKFNRTVLSIFSAMITYFILTFIEGAPFSIIIELLFGSSADGYVNFHSLGLIFGMMIIVQIAFEGGVFQYISFNLLKMTKGRPLPLLIVFSCLGLFITAVLTDTLTILLLIPLTITVCQILAIDAKPYIIAEAIMIKLGATVLSISSIPTIIISNYLQIDFQTYFISIGLIAICMFIVVLTGLSFYLKKKLPRSEKGLDILLEINVKNFITNRSLMIKSSITLFGVVLCFILIPPSIATPDIIAITGAMILLLISRLDLQDFFQKIDFGLILYLLGVFVMSGGLEYVGVVNYLGALMQNIGNQDIFITFISIMWISALSSAFVDNVPLTRLLTPITATATSTLSPQLQNFAYSGLIFGVNWGDNFTPFGDTLIILNIAQNHHTKIQPMAFFKIGFIVTLSQFLLLTIIATFIFHFQIAVIILGILIIIGVISGTFYKLHQIGIFTRIGQKISVSIKHGKKGNN